MPVVGNNFILTPTWISTWNTINKDDPIKISLLLVFFSYEIFLKVLKTRIKNTNSIISIRKIPNSSEITDIT